jgi:hypothetical protein
LFWDNNATGSSHFDGYVIYRSEGRIKDYMTVYEKIFECNVSKVVHQCCDTTAQSGMNYYYYIQSKDDGTQNDLYPGTPLYSSMFLTMTNIPGSRITGVAENTAGIPAEFSLKQNYPNPFNPVTTISFGLPEQSFVKLKVYDVTGREVATIVSEELPAGKYSRQWNAYGISNGVYYYRIQAGRFTETKKLVLVK